MTGKLDWTLHVLFTASIYAMPETHDLPTKEVSAEEIEVQGEVAPAYHFSTQGFINIEKLLENPELEELFGSLSVEEQDDLIENIEQLNEAFGQALREMTQELPDTDSPAL